MKILSTLPLFSGFYSTYWEPSEDYFLESEGGEYEDYEFDYEDYYNDVGKLLSTKIQEMLQGLGLDIKITFKKVDSPRFYNYRNDAIEVEYEFNEQTKEDIYDKIFNELEEFEGYLADNFTSRDGFIPYYSNKAIDWLRERGEHSIDDYVVLKCLLEFILMGEIREDEFYIELMDELPILHGRPIEDES